MGLNSDLLKDKVVLITGSNRGIGRGILECFLENGAIVYAVSRFADAFEEILIKDSGTLIPCYLDITDKNAVRDLFSQIKSTHNRLDVLVNNAGVMQDALLGMITQEQMEKTFSVNVFSMILLMQYSVKFMGRQKSGSIINLTSIMGIQGNAGQIVYSASKGAVISMTKSAAKELAPMNIRVNAIAPGIIKTDLLNTLSDQKMEQSLLKVGMGRIGTPYDVAQTALYLASDMSEYVSGQIIGVDGVMVV